MHAIRGFNTGKESCFRRSQLCEWHVSCSNRLDWLTEISQALKDC